MTLSLFVVLLILIDDFYILWKRGGNRIGIKGPAAKQCCGLKKISYRAYLFFLLFGDLKRIAFLSVIRLLHSQLWAIIKRASSLIQCYNHCVLKFLTDRFPGALQRGCVPKYIQASAGVSTRILQIQLQRLKPLKV